MSDDVLRFAVSAQAERAALLHYPIAGTAADLLALIDAGALHERCVVLLIAGESECAAAEALADEIGSAVAAVRVDLLPKPAPEAEPEPATPLDIEQEAERLARLSAAECSIERKASAARLRISIADLKKAESEARQRSARQARKAGEESGKETQTETLLRLAADHDLFADTEREEAFASFENESGGVETWAVTSSRYESRLRRLFHDDRQRGEGGTGCAPSDTAMKAAIDTLKARALYGNPRRTVHLRVAGHEGAIYIDLGDETWRAVEVTVSGWRIVERPPMRFRRPNSGMVALPMPERGGSIDALRPFLNTADEDGFVLAVALILSGLRPQGPHVVGAVSGPQGSAKSTFCRVVRRLIDPAVAALTKTPRTEEDLFIAAEANHLLAFDNASSVADWLSDALCMVSTGGGLAKRKLYSDREVETLQVTRPVLLNGITEMVGRPDLADRSIFLTLVPIAEEARKDEASFWTGFEAAAPYIFGAILDGLVEGLRRKGTVRLKKLPRMADFALWATACETAYWPAGTVMSAYDRNRAESILTVLEDDAVASAILRLVASLGRWQGTASELHNLLSNLVGEGVARSKAWPALPKGLSARLKRAQTFLRAVGIEVSFTREGKERNRCITIERVKPPGASADASEDARRSQKFHDASAINPLKNKAENASTDAADAKDAKNRQLYIVDALDALEAEIGARGVVYGQTS